MTRQLIDRCFCLGNILRFEGIRTLAKQERLLHVCNGRLSRINVHRLSTDSKTTTAVSVSCSPATATPPEQPQSRNVPDA